MALFSKNAISLLGAVACVFQPAGQVHRQTFRMEMSREAMGSTVSLVLYGNDRSLMEQAAAAALKEAKRLDRELSNYKSDSELTSVNRQAASHALKVTPELFQLLTACAEYSRESAGAFDITVGPLMKVWGFYRHAPALPRSEDLALARSQVGYFHVHLDSNSRSVSFDRPGVELDPGGIGKGYAVDQMVKILKLKGIHSALISASRSSIYGLGAPPGELRGWPVAIDTPLSSGSPPITVYLKNMSLSTSGSDQKFFHAQGKIYSHIMDPRTGYPASGSALVAVIARRTVDSEAWTKPVFINGADWAATHLPKSWKILFCGDRNGDTCYWLS